MESAWNRQAIVKNTFLKNFDLGTRLATLLMLR